MPPSPQPQVELERLIVQGLACEWDEACAALDPLVRGRLRRPLFALKDLVRRWGSWSRDRQEISFSRALVLNHDWGDVRDVLLHEMAHQLADQALDGLNDPPHGPAFHTACGMLGADPGRPGPSRLSGDASSIAANGDTDRDTRRIRKLLRLAGSPNRHEAEAAMLKAHELMARHTRTMIATNSSRAYMSVFVGEPALRHARSCYHLAALLRDFYFVLPVWIPTYVVPRGRMGRVLEISGMPKNVRTRRPRGRPDRGGGATGVDGCRNRPRRALRRFRAGDRGGVSHTAGVERARPGRRGSGGSGATEGVRSRTAGLWAQALRPPGAPRRCSVPYRRAFARGRSTRRSGHHRLRERRRPIASTARLLQRLPSGGPPSSRD